MSDRRCLTEFCCVAAIADPPARPDGQESDVLATRLSITRLLIARVAISAYGSHTETACRCGGHHVDQTIARLNIEHFHRLLKSEIDPDKRATITRLLAEEEAKLRSINAESNRMKRV